LRLPLDILFIFTANPEDYTNRGSIITPLKDRIESQILTHYPKTTEIAKKITSQEINVPAEIKDKIVIPELIRDLLEYIVFEARDSEFIDEKSGVSARLSISALENLYSNIHRRMLKNKQETATARISDFWGIIPSITGKVELVYEGEQEGPHNVAMSLIQEALEEKFDVHFPDPDKVREGNDDYEVLRIWFSSNNSITLSADDSDKVYQEKLNSVPGLKNIAKEYSENGNDLYFMMELILNGLAKKEVINFNLDNQMASFNDLLSSGLSDLDENLFN